MKYKNKELILDNFREVLKEFTIDVQDVVRSAILDGVDISKYIETCNPYKLDQIRLGIKENLNPEFFSVNGPILYQIRRMKREGIDISPLEKYLKASLTDEHIEYLLKWVQQGINFLNIDVATIPKSLLSVYDKGLRLGVNMKKYSKIYSARYIDLCIQLEKMFINTDFLVKDTWSIDVLEFLSRATDLSKEEWTKVSSYIKCTDDLDRVQLLIKMIKNNIDLKPWQEELESKEYKYSNSCLEITLDAFKENIDINKLLQVSSYKEMSELFAKLKLSKELKVSGRFLKNRK